MSYLQGIKNLSKAFIADSYVAAFGAKGKFSSLKERTAFVRSNDITPESAILIREKIDEVLKIKNHPRVWQDDLGADMRILGFENDMPEIVDILNIREHIKSISMYLGRSIKSWHLMANRISFIEDNLGSGGGYHRDSPFSHEVKCIWYLCNVGIKNGPFEYLNYSHFNSIKQRKKYALGQSRFKKLYNGDKTSPVIGNTGTMVVCDTKCIHRGKPIAEGNRHAVTLYTSVNKDDKARRIRPI